MISTATNEWERSLGEWGGAFADADAVGDAVAAIEGKMGVGYCNLHLGRIEAATLAFDEAIMRSENREADPREYVRVERDAHTPRATSRRHGHDEKRYSSWRD